MGGNQGFVEVNGARLVYEDTGKGYPVVLIHGFGLDLHSWDEQVSEFSRVRRVIRYDLRGFGGSSLPGDQPYNHVDDLQGLLGELGVARADVIGVSMGGRVAADFALTFPTAVRALVLVDAALGGLGWSPEIQDALRAPNLAVREGGLDAARQAWFKHPMFATVLANPAASGPFRSMMADYSGWHWLNRDPQTSPKTPALERLADIHAPTLVIAGEHDIPDLRGSAEFIANGIAGAQHVEIPGAGHLPNMEAPAAFNEVVLGFLAHLDAVDTPAG